MTDKVHAFFYIEDVAIDFRIHVSYRGQDACSVILTDVVAEDVVDALALTKHHTATAIVAAIVVLVDRSVTGVGIPRLTILIIDSVVDFVVLEQRCFAFPWHSDIFRHIVLDQRFKAVHRCNAVSADIFDKVVFDHDIGGAVGFHHFIGQFQCGKFVMLVRVACGNSPSAAVLNFTVVDMNTVITGNSGLFFVIRTGD